MDAIGKPPRTLSVEYNGLRDVIICLVMLFSSLLTPQRRKCVRIVCLGNSLKFCFKLIYYRQEA
jgi:hypothetical protein